MRSNKLILVMRPLSRKRQTPPKIGFYLHNAHRQPKSILTSGDIFIHGLEFGALSKDCAGGKGLRGCLINNIG